MSSSSARALLGWRLLPSLRLLAARWCCSRLAQWSGGSARSGLGKARGGTPEPSGLTPSITSSASWRARMGLSCSLAPALRPRSSMAGSSVRIGLRGRSWKRRRRRSPPASGTPSPRGRMRVRSSSTVAASGVGSTNRSRSRRASLVQGGAASELYGRSRARVACIVRSALKARLERWGAALRGRAWRACGCMSGVCHPGSGAASVRWALHMTHVVR